MLSSGTRLGAYEIVSPIGAGGMGQVYLARDTRLGRSVAVKVLPEAFIADAALRARFEREAQTISSLNHPRICALHDIGQQDGVEYLVMEHIEGETLAARIARGPLELSAVIRIAEQIAEAIEDAHAHGITHRDLKPANIMITARGDVKVLDFGLAKSTLNADPGADEVTALRSSAGLIVGTLAYMSPEQLQTLPVDWRSDLFSLGAIVFEMTTGSRPFGGSSAAELIANILRSEVPAVSDLRPGVPPALDRIVHRLLYKDPAGRYQSATEFLTEWRAMSSSYSSSPVKTKRLGRRLVIPALLGLTAVVVGVTLAPKFSRQQQQQRQIESMAVLPFVNRSRDPGLEYLSDGLAESAIEHVSSLPGLRVMARSTSFRYRNQQFDPQKIGRELNVAAILTGEVVQRTEGLSVTAEMVNSEDGSRIWGARYGGEEQDALFIQQRLARDLSRLLRPDHERNARRGTDDGEVYQLYLQGRHALNKWTPESHRAALGYFDRAIQRDPSYALAYAGMAAAYVTFEPYSGAPASEWLPRARAAAMRALDLDPDLAEAHASLAMVHFNSFEWMEAEQRLRRAIRLNPNYAEAHDWYSQYLVTMGRRTEALREAERARQLDSLSPTINANVAACRLLTGDLDRGIAELKRLSEVDPDFPLAYQWLAFGYMQTRQFDLAVEALRRGVEVSGGSPLSVVNLAFGYLQAGRREEARRIAAEVIQRYEREAGEAIIIAGAYVAAGEDEKALDWLERGAAERIGTMTYVTWPPWFDHLIPHPRYLAVLRKMGLPQTSEPSS